MKIKTREEKRVFILGDLGPGDTFRLIDSCIKGLCMLTRGGREIRFVNLTTNHSYTWKRDDENLRSKVTPVSAYIVEEVENETTSV